MSAEVIANSLLGLGLRNLSGGGLAFVNFSRGQLLNGSWELFEPQSVVIELLESVECDYETLAACQRMVKAGYKLALDDYVPDAKMRPLLELASIVKIDVLNRPHPELARRHDRAPTEQRPPLAERVETATVRDMCADLGYELFQGFLFSRPETLTKTRRFGEPARDHAAAEPASRSTHDRQRARCGVPERRRALLQAASHRERGVGGRARNHVDSARRSPRRTRACCTVGLPSFSSRRSAAAAT